MSDYGLPKEKIDIELRKNIKNKYYERSKVKWPQNNTTALQLFDFEKIIIIVDNEIICTRGFVNFIREWCAYNEMNGMKKTLYMPEFEFDLISLTMRGMLQTLFDRSVLVKFGSGKKDYDELFIQKEIDRPIILFTKSIEKAKKIKNIAWDKRKELRFYTLNDEGKVVIFDEGIKFKKDTVPIEEKFQIMTEITPCRLATKLPQTSIGKGMYVFDEKGKAIALLQEFMSNAVSITYKTNVEGKFAKIYTLEILKTTYFEDKARLMLKKRIKRQGIGWPISMLYSSDGSFVGTLIPEAEGLPLMHSILGEEQLKKNFPQWNKKDLCDLTICILEHIVFLQERNIFFGCINPQSIFVKDKDNVHFVDLDCYQIEGYHCVSQNITFQPPEFQMQGIQKRLYTKQTENYGIATLTFMLLMPGKLPYAKENNADMATSIANMKFPFSWNGQPGNKEVDRPSGMWRFVWSHLGNLKGAFYNTFMRNREFNAPQKRKSVSFWLREVCRLRDELEHPQDPESLELFPKTFRRDKNTVFFRCQYCNAEYPQFYFYRKYFNTRYRICNSCLNTPSDKGFECVSSYHVGADRKFIYSKKLAIYHQMATIQNPDWHKQRYCSECKHIRMQVYKTLQCRGCNCMFDFTFGQKEDYNRRFGIGNWKFPNYCPECQSKRKQY